LNFSDVFARFVAVIGATALHARRLTGGSPEPAWGSAPAIPPPRPQGNLPTLKMPTAQGWAAGQTPVTAPGLKVNAFARGLKHPRWIIVLPNGDVLVAESSNVPRTVMRSVFDYAMVSTMKRAGAVGVSANRVTLLRDADGDGVAEIQDVFLEGLNQPFGMALVGDTFYVGNTDGVVAFPYTPGATRLTAPGRTLATFRPGGHWTRSLLPGPDGSKLYVGVGSSSNIAENGMADEEGRALIHELDLATGMGRTFASGLRSPPPSRRITLWAGTPRHWDCAGCPPVRCPAFRTAWRSGNTGRGTAANSAATSWCSFRSRTDARPDRRAISFRGSSGRMSACRTDGPLA
jgi:hypothetical protein